MTKVERRVRVDHAHDGSHGFADTARLSDDVVLERAGAIGVFIFIAAAMGVVMATIGLFGPRTSNLALEQISG